jgi:hypothetical protein
MTMPPNQAMHYSRLADAVIGVYDTASNLFETQGHTAISKNADRVCLRGWRAWLG